MTGAGTIKAVETLEMAGGLTLFIVRGKIASYEASALDGRNAYARARAAHAAGHEESAFLGRWLKLSEDMVERYGRADRGRYAGDRS